MSVSAAADAAAAAEAVAALEGATREEKLSAVFHAFDLDHNGTIGKDELLALGKARRELGLNAEAVATLDLDYAAVACARPAFDAAFRYDVAASLGADAASVSVISVTAGSAVVGFRVAGLPDAATALADGRLSTSSLTAFNGGSPVAVKGVRAVGGEWTEEMNDRMAAKLDQDCDGVISRAEFTSYFAAALPTEKENFDAIVEQSLMAAKACSRRKRDEASEAAVAAAVATAEEQAAAARDSAVAAAVEEATASGADAAVARARAEAAEAAEATDRLHRAHRLSEVFNLFDMDDSDSIGREELLQLGRARRELGQKGGEWTEEKNDALLLSLDTDGSGDVSRLEFLRAFDASLPKEREPFDATIEQFLRAAKVCNRGKRESAAAAAAQEAADASSRASQAEAAEAAAAMDRLYRAQRLGEVFSVFDLDHGGSITEDELFELGSERRRMGQASGSWTREMNRRLMKKLDKDNTGAVSKSEFCDYFAESLPKEREPFDDSMEQFLRAAKACIRKKSEAAAVQAAAVAQDKANAAAEAAAALAAAATEEKIAAAAAEAAAAAAAAADERVAAADGEKDATTAAAERQLAAVAAAAEKKAAAAAEAAEKKAAAAVAAAEEKAAAAVKAAAAD